MKKIVLLVLVFTFFMKSGKAQTIPVPNSFFLDSLRTWYPTCFTQVGAQWYMDTTCNEIVNEDSLTFNGDNRTHSISAIQYFDNLTYLYLHEVILDDRSDTISFPSSLQILEFRYVRATKLPRFNQSLRYFDCAISYLDENTIFGTLPDSLRYFNCSGNYLTSLPVLPPFLDTLSCEGQRSNLWRNQSRLESLPTLPSTLKYLNCGWNRLTSLPTLPSSLEYLNCADNRETFPTDRYVRTLTDLPPLPQNLKYLYCFRNGLSTLPSLPDSLITLDCSRNVDSSAESNNPGPGISSISSLPDRLEELICYANSIINLPALPPGLLMLESSFNPNLTSFPSLPGSLIHLGCGGTGISALPAMPNTLRTLTCGYNDLTVLPPLPDSLRILFCESNNLNFLPSLPDSLEKLHCDSNPLLYLPELPHSLIQLWCDSTNLTCLPHLPMRMGTEIGQLNLRFVGTNISCLPNAVPNIRAYPHGLVCTVLNNSNNCQLSPVIFGKVFYDLNSNGLKEANEFYKQNVAITLDDVVHTFSDVSGFYIISADTGINVLSVNAGPLFTSSPSSFSFNFSSFDTSVVQDIPIQATRMVDSLSVVITPIGIPRPGFEFSYDVSFENVGTNPVPAQISLQFDPALLTYISSNVGGVNVSGNLISFDAGMFHPGDIGRFQSYFRVNINAILGDSLTAVASIDGSAAVATDSSTMIIRGSYDPNDKLATPSLTTGQISVGNFIYYTVRFQNTGTDTAFNVIITDTLSGNLDANSFRMVGASHPCIATRIDNQLLFEFKSIHLLDSNVNEPLSHGYIKFRVKAISTLTDGDVVNNSASIYFDYNAPVATNTATTTITSPFTCATAATITVTQPSCIAPGMILVTAATGIAPILYSINGGAMQSTAIFNNLTAGSYAVLVQDANMCTYTETVTINTSPGTVVPSVSIGASSVSVCAGEPVTFTATATNGGANPQYQWVVNGANTGTNSAILTIHPATNSDVSAQLTSNDPCASPATANSNTVIVAVNPSQTPSITISGNTTVDQGASATINSSVANGGTTPSYQWQDSTSTNIWTNITGATNASIDYAPQQTGDGLRCILTSTATCTSSTTATSNVLYFTVESTTIPRARLYPNPVRSILTIENNTQTQWVTADILDDNGRRVSMFMNTSGSRDVIMDVSKLMSAVYFIRLIDRSGKPEYFKFIKQ